MKIEIPAEDINANNYWPPHPTVIVSTVSEKGVPNAAPYGIAQFLSYMEGTVFPKIIMVGLGGAGEIFDGSPHYRWSEKEKKKTYKNIVDTKDFVVNIPSKDLMEKINLIAQRTPPELNKFETYGLTPLPSRKVKSPSVGECRVHFECELMGVHDFGGAHDLVLGKVVGIVMDEEVSKAKVEDTPELIQPLFYHGLGKGKGVYYSLGQLIGQRDEKLTP